jgi:hypothetical protein
VTRPHRCPKSVPFNEFSCSESIFEDQA